MRKILIFIVLLSAYLSAQVQVGSTYLEATEIINNLDIPWEIKWGPDNTIWMTERPGIVSRVDVETGQKSVILDIESQVYNSNESGLLGMEIHPEFNNGQPYVFLVYTYLYSWGDIRERIVMYEYNFIEDQLFNETILLDNIDGNSTHIGCRLMALSDMTMLITTGDAQNWNASQDLNELTGKTLRMSINTLDGTLGNPP